MAKESDNYIFLQEAIKYCSYSQEYLSLRARQGKLKAVKFGRNWVTKKEWLEEYLEKVEEYNNNLKAENVVAPPGNLPIEKPVPLVRFGFVVALVFVLLVAGIFYGSESFKVVYRDASPFVQEFSGGFDRGVAEVFETVSSYTYIVGGAGDIIVENTIKVASDTISDIPQSFRYVYGEINSQLSIVAWEVAGVGEVAAGVFKEYGQWLARNTTEWFSSQTKEIVQNYLAANEFVEEKISWGTKQMVDGTKMIGEGFEIFSQNLNSKFKTQTSKLAKGYFTANNFVERKISQGYKTVTQFWRAPEKIVEEELIPKPGKEGMVMIPSTEKDEEVKEKIKAAFSDEVKVEPKDETSGIIIPIFKEGEGQKYLYILVPVNIE